VAVLAVVDRVWAERGVITGGRACLLEVIHVTELTVSGCATKDTTGVAGATGDEAVRARQPEACLVVKEGAG